MLSARIALVLALAFAAALLHATGARAATYSVTTTADTGAGSLRQAILDANASPGHDTIAFAIPQPPGPPGPLTIVPASDLPRITSPVTIDGYTQPQTSANTAIIGTNAVLRIVLSGATVPDAVGLALDQGSGGSTLRGLVINGFGGSNGAGVTFFDGPGTSGSAIEGCFIGTDAGGTTPVPNRFGVALGAALSRVGGGTPAARNLVSGNAVNGINANRDSATIQGNLIGTRADGVLPLGNGGRGIAAGGAGGRDIRIGGANAGEANVIAYNALEGVVACGLGVRLERNRIFANGALGIDLGDCNFPDGVTANDRRDDDTGANARQNTPVVWLSTLAPHPTPGTSVRQVTGYLDSRPNRSYRIEIYTNLQQDASGHGEGEAFLESVDVTTDANGYAYFNRTIAPVATPLANSFVSATATDLASGDTSEFSASAVTLSALRVTSIAESGPGSQRVVIDGYTQIGAKPNFADAGSDAVLTVELDGSLAGAASGLSATGPLVTIRGLALNRFAQHGLSTTSSARVEGNFIGTDLGGLLGRGNGLNGVDASGAATIGGALAMQRNVIAGNGMNGVRVAAALAAVRGNIVGRGRDAATPIANGAHGILLATSSANFVSIGGVEPGEGNLVASNTGAGIGLAPDVSDGNHIAGNRTVDNGGLGIDIAPVGVNANDVDDADAGPNNRRNFPVLTSAAIVNGRLEIVGTLDRPATPAAPIDYILAFYSNSRCDASNHGEGETPLGSVVVPIDVAETFSVSLSDVAIARNLTATASELDDGTSELSACIPVALPDALFSDSFEAGDD